MLIVLWLFFANAGYLIIFCSAMLNHKLDDAAVTALASIFSATVLFGVAAAYRVDLIALLTGP